MKPYKAVLFDLDGTLADTLGDLRDAVNASLLQLQFPVHTTEEIQAAVGNGVRNLILRSLPADASASADQALALFRTYYAKHLLVHTRPYPGIPAQLAQLKAAGLRLGVVSNKYDAAVQTICSALFPGTFDVICGETPDCPRKPAPDLPLRAAALLHVTPAETLFVGDSETDVQTAQNARMDVLAVTWGFRSRAQLRAAGAQNLADQAEEIAPFVLSGSPLHDIHKA